MVSGCCALALEVVGTRLLMQSMPGSAWSFAAVLVVFLAGIAIGSAAYSRFGGAPERAMPILLALLGIGVAAAAPLSLLAPPAPPSPPDPPVVGTSRSVPRSTGTGTHARGASSSARTVSIARVLMGPTPLRMRRCSPLACCR
jgi:hypothetical protein